MNSLDEAEEDGDNSLRPGRTSPALSVAGSMTASADARRLQGRIIYELELVSILRSMEIRSQIKPTFIYFKVQIKHSH